MTVRPSRRLPGFRFEVQPPPPTNALPRMDVAVFVGFAASGPLHKPVAVEDIAQFRAIFGNDVPLAWDRQRGELVYAYLAPTVRSFFQNGGQRCWIIRVASPNARSNTFPLPALACINADGSLIQPAFAQARSEGSWSDNFTIGTSLFSRQVDMAQIQQESQQFVLDVAATSANDIIAGDLLRLTFSAEGFTLLLAVETVAPQKLSPAERVQNRSTLRVTCGKAFWFKWPSTNRTPTGPLQVIAFTQVGEKPPLPIKHFTVDEDQTITLDLQTDFANAPMPGQLIRIDGASEPLWMTVQGTFLLTSIPESIVQLQGQGLWYQQQAPALPNAHPFVEKLTFTAWTRQNGEDKHYLTDLAFTPQHPRFWNALPTDAQIYQDVTTTSDTAHSMLARALENNFYAPLWSEASDPRFPLAGNDVGDVIYLPIGMPLNPDFFLGHDKGPDNQFDLALIRDGLESFSANLFLDWDLLEMTTQEVLAQADFLRYQSELARPLQGIYAALDLDEASIIAIPDALHRGWFQASYDDIIPPADTNAAAMDDQGRFLTCPSFLGDPPVLSLQEEVDTHGTFTLAWSISSDPLTSYTLQEALNPDWSDAVTVYTGTDHQFVMYGRADGDYYYRVRREVRRDRQTSIFSQWSKGFAVRTQPAKRWELTAQDAYDPNDLLVVQRALTRMCAARGDLLAVLSLPAHYREDAAMAHVQTLKAPMGLFIQLNPSTQNLDAAKPDDASIHTILPFGYEERSSFSFSALYHPWLVCYEGQTIKELRTIPPDGAATGIIARRALARGAWIAPANEQFYNIVALIPQLEEAYRQRLQNAQINGIHREPRGFIALSADTLSDENDADLRPINVRRLLMLVRRLALRLGATFVFEPDGAAFQRLVRRSFEGLLEDMFVRGAFAGSTTASSFRVIIDTSLADQGRFIVELRVAPALPLTFLTIRLVQDGTTTAVTEAR